MKQNMGTMDKATRILVAILIVILYFTNVIGGVLAIILLSIAALFVATSFIGVCPLYSAFGLRTNKKETGSAHKV
jgi:uncharacterized membrane protein